MDRKSLFKLGARRIAGAVREAAYLHAGLDITQPETIRAMVTRRCNYKCQYCYDWQWKNHQEMSIDEWKWALLGIKEYIGAYYVAFSGGEPFVKVGFVDLLEFCQGHGIAWSVITNGSALNRHIVPRVVRAGPLHIDISVDSPVPEINDDVRGAKDSLRRIGDGMALVNAERRRQRQDFLIRAKPTVTRQNFLDLPRLVTWAIDHGADSIDFAPVRPGEFWEWDKTLYVRLWISEGEMGKFRDTIAALVALKQGGAPIETSVEKLQSLPLHFLGQEVGHGASPCRVGLRDFHILPSGDVRVCWEHPCIGNITRQSAREIWQSAQARAVRSNTVACNLFKTMRCANSCLNHKTLKQEFERVVHWARLGR